MSNPIRQSYVEQKSWIDEWLSYLAKINPCLRLEKQSQQLSRFLESFTQISLYHDPYFGECYLLESKIHDTLKIMKKQNYSQKIPQNRKNVIQQIQSFNSNSNVVEQKQICTLLKKGFIWTNTQIYLVYDYIFVDLQKQFESRITKGQKFTEAQLLIIIKESSKGFVHLEATNYNSVSMKNIYFCEKQIKVAHPKLFNYKSNLSFLLEDQNMKGIYIAPQQMISLEKGQVEANYGWRANSFTFGMVVLSLMSMQYLNQMYDPYGCQIYYHKIQSLIAHVRKLYSEKLVRIVEGLLRQKPEQRITFRNLLNRISQNYQPQKQIQLTLTNEKVKVENKYQSLPKKQQKTTHVNYLSGLIYPKVGLVGEYFDFDKNQKSIPKSPNDPTIIANSRYFYGVTNSQYIGDSIQEVIGSKQHPVREGKGIYRTQDGQLYVGEWKKGEMDGFGKLYWNQNKIRYQGQFKNGKFQGKGVEYPDNSKQDSDIDYTFVRMQKGNWLKYEGYYKNDQREGQGVVYFHRGKWMGNFKNDQPDGQGIYYDNNGLKHSGVYKNGILQ